MSTRDMHNQKRFPESVEVRGRTTTGEQEITPATLKEVEDVHRKAMEYAEQAFVAKANGNLSQAKKWTLEAYKLERQAADMVDKYDVEPTRSVLHRSAADLALDCGHYEEAVKLARRGLRSSPPGEIERELRDTLERIPKDILSSVPEPAPDDAVTGFQGFANVNEILVEYDPITDRMTVNPGQVAKGATVRFRDPKGNKLKIVFLSPEGNESDTVSDSDSCTMLVGGVYHFQCFFTPPGAYEFAAMSGGVLEVYPTRP